MNFPDEKYQIIYADPPWEMVRSFGGHNWESGQRDRPILDYPTMPVEEIKALPVQGIAQKDCNLYLWTTQKYLSKAFGVIDGWGFTPITTLIWCKQKGGFVGGAYFSNVEFLIYGRHGKANIKEKINTQWFNFPKGKHSEKPLAMRDMLCRVHGNLPRIELFARQQTPGWDSLGNDIDGMDMRESLELLGEWFAL